MPEEATEALQEKSVEIRVFATSCRNRVVVIGELRQRKATLFSL